MAASLETMTKSTILIVDDSRTVRVSLSRILRDNYTIIEAADGEEGWEKLREDPSIKLVITDIMMPKLDGYGFICRIRGADSTKLQKVPIIVVTSAEDELSRERAHACGANNFIVKPANPVDLLDRVNFHTEAYLLDGNSVSPQMAQYADKIENAVIEVPSVEEAIELLESGETAAVAPYAAELAAKIIPLLEYCDKNYDLDASEDIAALKEKLRAV